MIKLIPLLLSLVIVSETKAGGEGERNEPACEITNSNAPTRLSNSSINLTTSTRITPSPSASAMYSLLPSFQSDGKVELPICRRMDLIPTEIKADSEVGDSIALIKGVNEVDPIVSNALGVP
jgi:hypothetical protein